MYMLTLSLILAVVGTAAGWLVARRFTADVRVRTDLAIVGWILAGLVYATGLVVCPVNWVQLVLALGTIFALAPSANRVAEGLRARARSANS
jgi:hypothetical protein